MTYTAEIESLQIQLTSVESILNRLVKSVEDGMSFDLIQTRLEELEGQKTALKKTLTDKELAGPIKLTRDHIQFFLEKIRDTNWSDPKAQKMFIDTFIRTIFV